MLFFRREMQQKTDRPVIPPHPNTNMCTTQKDRKQRKPLLAVFFLVEVRRLELRASWSQTKRSTG